MEIPDPSPQPTSKACIRIRSATPVGTLVNITRSMVPVTIGCTPSRPARFIVIMTVNMITAAARFWFSSHPIRPVWARDASKTMPRIVATQIIEVSGPDL